MDLLQLACYTKEQQQRIHRGALEKQEFASEKKRISFFFQLRERPRKELIIEG